MIKEFLMVRKSSYIKNVFIILCAIMFFGCEQKINSYKSSFDLYHHFLSKGFKASVPQPIQESFGESEAWELTINGKVVDVLKYNTDIPSQKTILSKIRGRGKLINSELPVVVSGSFVIWTENLKDSQDIIGAFKEF